MPARNSSDLLFFDRLPGTAWGVLHHFNESGHFYSREVASEEAYYASFKEAGEWIEEAAREGRRGLDVIGERYGENRPRYEKLKRLSKESLDGGYAP